MQQAQSQLITLLMTALGVIIPAATGLLVAWLKARTEAQTQAILGAAHAVEQTDLDGPDKKAAAIRMAAQRLPDRLARNEEKLGALVEKVMPQVQAARPPDKRTTRPD